MFSKFKKKMYLLFNKFCKLLFLLHLVLSFQYQIYFGKNYFHHFNQTIQIRLFIQIIQARLFLFSIFLNYFFIIIKFFLKFKNLVLYL
jgi:hypothetical protein